MSHHSDPAWMRKLSELLKLGETGQFPEGKVHRSDEGELRLAVSVRQGKIILAMGKPTAWVGMNPDQAEQLGRLLLAHAEKAKA